MPVGSANEELAAKTSLTAIQELQRFRQEMTELKGEIATLRKELAGAPPAPAPAQPAAKPGLKLGRRMIVVIFCLVIGIGLAAGIPYVYRLVRASGAAPAANSGAATAGAAAFTLAGSNTLGDELVPHLVAAFLRSLHADAVEIRRTQRPDQFEVRGRLPGDAAFTTIVVNATGSENAFRDLAADKCDIGMSSRRITATEAGRLSKLGSMTSAACEHVIGLDGVAFIVNSRNRVKSLTTDQLNDLLSCRLGNWAQVGGAPAPVKLFRRNDDSGTYKTVRDLLLGGGEICSSADVIPDSEELSSRVAHDENALGFIGLPYVGANRALAIGEAGAPALVPNPITVGTEEYALSRRLYLYTPDHPVNPWVKRFVDFATSEPGQEQVMRAGFVGQNIMALPVEAVSRTAPARYRELTADAERLSLDFRFDIASSELDNKAIADFGRVASFFQDSRSGRRLMLFGFADSSGPRAGNCQLAQTRSETIASQLRALPVPVGTVVGFCDDLPVASNNTPEGRNRNRRVEVWVR